MKLRSAPVIAVLAIAAAALVTPAVASAQFTTFVAPPQKSDSVKAAAVVEKRAQTDSVVHMQLGDMKAWVDSAAGVGVAYVDTAAQMSPVAVGMDARATTPTTDRAVTTTFSDGAIAPNTASSLPALLMVGFLSIGIGLLLIAGRKSRV